jgi:hypothetical protein
LWVCGGASTGAGAGGAVLARCCAADERCRHAGVELLVECGVDACIHASMHACVGVYSLGEGLG